MIWLGGWRRCSRPLRSIATARTDRELQAAILDAILQRHPQRPTLPDLADELLAGSGDLLAALALATAVRDLVTAGLLQSEGLHVGPTRAALHWRWLARER